MDDVRHVFEGRNILILEDDVLLALDYEDFVHEMGGRVSGPYSSVHDAVKAIDSSIDGAIVDLNLRGEYSFPVLDKLRHFDIPTVVCTGYAELPGMKSRLNNVGVLSKPCDFRKLTQELSSRLAARQDGEERGNMMSQAKPAG